MNFNIMKICLIEKVMRYKNKQNIYLDNKTNIYGLHIDGHFIQNLMDS